MNKILLKDPDYVLTPDGVIEGENVLVEGSEIRDVGSSDKTGKVIDASGHAIMPGMVNMHTHSAMNILRGVSDDKKLDRFLKEDVWPREAKMTGEMVYWGSIFAFIEMIKTGTTTFNDMYFHMDSVAEAAEDVGMRGYLGYGMIDVGKENTMEEELKGAKDLVGKVNDHSDLLEACITPHSIQTCSEELLLKSKELADRHDTSLHMHISETSDEVEYINEREGKRTVEYLESLGIIDESFIGAHGVHLNKDEMDILSERNSSVVYNPCSNMKLVSGVAPVDEMLRRGVNVCLGTDGAVTNNNLDLLEELKIGSLLQKSHSSDPTTLPKNKAMNLPTRNASKALGDNIGKIEGGAKADLVLVDMDSFEMVPKHNIISNLIYSGSTVDTAVINGQIVLEDGNFTEIDQNKVYRKVEELAEEIA